MAAPDDNQRMPIANDRAIPRATLLQLEKLNETMQSVKDFLSAQQAPTGQTRLEREQHSLAGRQRAARPQSGMPPGIPDDRMFVAGPGGEESDTETTFVGPPQPRRVAAPSEVSFKKRFKQGKTNWGKPGGFSQGFLDPRWKGEYSEEDSSGSSSGFALPPNATAPGMTGISTGQVRIPGDSGPPSKVVPGVPEAQVEQMETARMKIPQFGDWQLDNYLEMASNVFGRLAKTRSDEGKDGTFTQGLGKVSGWANYGRGYAAEAELAKRKYQKAMAYGQESLEMGAGLGYSPQDGAGPSNILGFRNPLSYLTSSAGQQGIGMRMDAYAMARTGTGLSVDQSQKIFQSLAEQGWSNQESGFLGAKTGGNLENIASELVAPVVKNTGMSPNVASGFAEALRNGNASIEQLHQTLENLGPAAQSSRLTIDQLGQSLQEFAAQQESMGATQAQGLKTGLSWVNSTGMAPQTLSKIQESPIYQGLAMTQAGTLPSGIGGLAGGTQTKLSLSSIGLLMSATKGLAKPKFETIDGHRIETESGETAQMGQVAQMLGVNPEEVERLWRNRKFTEHSAKAQTLLDANTASGWQNQYEGAVKKAGGKGNLSKEQRRILQQGGTLEDGQEVAGWHSISKQLSEAGVDSKTIRKISNEGFDKRAEDVHKALADKAKESLKRDGQNPVEVKFTGAAAKYFEQVPMSRLKSNQNSGGSLLSQAAADAKSAAQSIPGNPVGQAISLFESL